MVKIITLRFYRTQLYALYSFTSPNLDLFTCKITFVFSQNAIRFFYLYSIFKLEAWGDYTHDSSSDWQTIEVEIKDFAQLKEAVDNILNKFNSFVIDPLKAKYT